MAELDRRLRSRRASPPGGRPGRAGSNDRHLADPGRRGAVEREHPELGRHLRASVRTGHVLRLLAREAGRVGGRSHIVRPGPTPEGCQHPTERTGHGLPPDHHLRDRPDRRVRRPRARLEPGDGWPAHPASAPRSTPTVTGRATTSPSTGSTPTTRRWSTPACARPTPWPGRPWAGRRRGRLPQPGARIGAVERGRGGAAQHPGDLDRRARHVRRRRRPRPADPARPDPGHRSCRVEQVLRA